MGVDDGNGETGDRPTQANTPDVTLTFVDWLQQARRSRWLPLFHDVGALRDVRLWDFGESGGFIHGYKVQHEKVGTSSHEHPASEDALITYHDESILPLHRPIEPDFRRDSRSYPLHHTRRIFTCPDCSGTGQVRCDRCRGSGQCAACRGTGHISSGRSSKACGACHHSGRCPACGGPGHVPHRRCQGEGRLLAYQTKDYAWWPEEGEKSILSDDVNRHNVRRLIHRARRRGGSAPLAEFSEAEVDRATGVLNRRIRDLIVLAGNRQQELLRDIARRSDRILFQAHRREYIPLSYINLFLGAAYGQFFAAGTERHREVAHRLPINPWKCVAWLCLLAALALPVLMGAHTPVAAGLVVAALGLCGGGIAAGLWTGVQERKSPPPSQWFIFDDLAGERYGAWQFAYLLAQAISRSRLAHVADPWFTALLEPPQPDTVKSRNSFVFTLRQGRRRGRSRPPRQTEVIVVGNRAQRQYPQDVARMIRSAARLIWIAGGRAADELDRTIAAALAALPEETRRNLEVGVIFEGSTAPIPPERLVHTRALLGHEKIAVLAIPMQQMCGEALSGEITAEMDRAYQQIAAYSGLKPASPVPAPPSGRGPAVPNEVQSEVQREVQSDSSPLGRVMGRVKRPRSRN